MSVFCYQYSTVVQCLVIFSRLSGVNVLLKIEMSMCKMNVVAYSRILPALF